MTPLEDAENSLAFYQRKVDHLKALEQEQSEPWRGWEELWLVDAGGGLTFTTRFSTHRSYLSKYYNQGRLFPTVQAAQAKSAHERKMAEYTNTLSPEALVRWFRHQEALNLLRRWWPEDWHYHLSLYWELIGQKSGDVAETDIASRRADFEAANLSLDDLLLTGEEE